MKKDFDKLGGYDESLTGYSYEDVKLVNRAKDELKLDFVFFPQEFMKNSYVSNNIKTESIKQNYKFDINTCFFPKFIVFVPYCDIYKDYIVECLDSITSQIYKNYEIIVVNDGSSDTDFLHKYSGITLINNSKQEGKSSSVYKFITHLKSNLSNYKQHDIVTFIDGDDHLLSKSAFQIISNVYTEHDIWSTCGSYSGKWCNEINKNVNTYVSDINRRQKQMDFYFPHLRTFRLGLINYIDHSKLIFNNQYIQCYDDVLLFSYIIELCGKNKIYHIKDILYFYREHSQNHYKITSNENKLAIKEYIFNLKPSKPITNYNMCYSTDQKKFNHFLITNNIKQLYVSKSLSTFSRYKSIHFLSDYKFLNLPVLIFGVYDKEDIDIVANHKGNIFIMYGGTDCSSIFENRKRNIKEIMEKKPNAIYISTSKCIFNRLNNYCIKHVVHLENDMVDYNYFSRISNLGDKIYIYDGNSKSDPRIYNKKIVDEIIALLPQFQFVRTSNIKSRIKYDEMKQFYEQFFIVLRLTEQDGGSETTKECNALEIPIVHNQSDSGLKWRTRDDIIHHIKREYKKHQTNKSQIIISIFDSITENNVPVALFKTVDLLRKHGFKIKIQIPLNSNYCVKYEFIQNTIYTPHEVNCDIMYNLENGMLESEHSDITLITTYQNKNDKHHENSIYANIIRFNFSKTKTQNNLFSVIIPLYNNAKYLMKALQSVDDQTFKNTEVVIVDDNSNDDPFSVINMFKENSSLNIKYYRNRVNRGCYISRNIGLMNSTGKYILFLDPDDELKSNRLETDFNILQNKYIRCVRSKYIRFDSDRSIQNNFPSTGKFGEITFSYKRDVFNDIGLFHENRFSSDSEFLERLLKSIDSNSIQKYNEITYFAYIKSDKSNLTCTVDLEKRKNFVCYYRDLHKNNLQLSTHIILDYD